MMVLTGAFAAPQDTKTATIFMRGTMLPVMGSGALSQPQASLHKAIN
jgi:hypothetical protein